MSKFAWGSSQYDEIAKIFAQAQVHGFYEAVKLLETEDIFIEADANIAMLNCLCLGQCGLMLKAWKNASKDLWFALNMMDDIVFKYGMSMIYEGKEVDNDNPIRLALIALFLVENKGCTEDDFKGFDT